MKRLRTSNLFQRILTASSVAIGLAASVAPLGSADAATVTLTGGAGSCIYSQASVDANGNTTYTCNTTTIPPSTDPGTLSFSVGSATTASGVGTTVAVNRTSGTYGAVYGNAIAAGTASCTQTSTTVNFANNSAVPSPQSIVVTPYGNAGDSCTVYLAAGGANLGTPNTFVVTIGTPSIPTCAPTASPASIDTTSTTTISANCTGATSYTWTGGPPAATGASATIGPFATTGTYTYTVTGTNGAGTSVPASVTVTVNPPAPGANCTTTADHILAYPNHNFYVDGTKKNESTAVSMAIGPSTLSPGNGLGKFTVVESSSTGYNTDIQFTVSACPGDFNVTPGSSCGITKIATGGALTFAVGELPPGVAWWAPVCLLPAGTSTVYFNFRQVVKGPGTTPAVPLTPSCSIGSTCPVWVQFN